MDQNYEPMEVDLSARSNSPMDISFNSSSATDVDAYLEADDFNLPPAEPQPLEQLIATEMASSNCKPSPVSPLPTNIKKFYIKMQKEKPYTISLKTKLICSVIVLLLSLATYQVMYIQCSDDINIEELNRNLSLKLFGQSQAVRSLIEALSVPEKSKVLFFYGGTGVGKTLTASLILERVGRYSNVYHYIMPSFLDTFTVDFMLGLSVCKHTIMVVDDLSAKDLNVNSHIEAVVAKSQNLAKDITVILIYNCNNAANDYERQCDESFPSKLLQSFSQVDAFKKLIKFDPLKEEHLRRCIEIELGRKHLSDIEFRKLLKNFNVSQDGCKSVYTKMKMLEVS